MPCFPWANDRRITCGGPAVKDPGLVDRGVTEADEDGPNCGGGLLITGEEEGVGCVLAPETSELNASANARRSIWTGNPAQKTATKAPASARPTSCARDVRIESPFTRPSTGRVSGAA